MIGFCQSRTGYPRTATDCGAVPNIGRCHVQSKQVQSVLTAMRTFELR